MRTTTVLSIGAVLAGGAVAQADIILDQIGDTSLTFGVFAAQQFTPVNSSFDVQVVDDFTMDADGQIKCIEAVIGGFQDAWAGLDFVDSYNINIYSSSAAAAANNVGDVYSANVAAPDSRTAIAGDPNLREVAKFNTAISLAAGTYWVSVQPVNEFGTNGQTGISGYAAAGNAMQANPNGGFGFPGNIQGMVADLDGDGVPDSIGAAYRIDANLVPAPGALALLGLAGLAGRRRRR